MANPGVDVRPIPTASRESNLFEVFLDEVRISMSNVVGGAGKGWSVAMSTLGFERGTAFTAGQMALHKPVEKLIEAAADLRAEALRAWGVPGPPVVGMSLGGLTAVALAARSPGLATRLVVVDVTPSVLARVARMTTAQRGT